MHLYENIIFDTIIEIEIVFHYESLITNCAIIVNVIISIIISPVS